MDEEWRAKFHQKIEEIAKSTAKMMGGDCDVEIPKGYPFLVNDPQTTETCRSAAEELHGIDKIEDLDLRMTAEDFAFFSQHCPVCFLPTWGAK